MAIYNSNSNNGVSPSDKRISSVPPSLKDSFIVWLNDGNVKKIASQECVDSFERVSAYAKSKKICACSLWNVHDRNIFASIYNKIMSAKLLRILEGKTYRTFSVAGQLYIKFLKEKPWEKPLLVQEHAVETPEPEEHKRGSKKYVPITKWLKEDGRDTIQASFSDIIHLVGELPQSAYKYRAFWANCDTQPFSFSWINAGYKLSNVDFQNQVVLFIKDGIVTTPNEINTPPKQISPQRITVKSSLIIYSNEHKDEVKTRKEIVAELTQKYGHNELSILPADYEVSLTNDLPKLFKRVDYGKYLCLGYNPQRTHINKMYSIPNTNSDFDAAEKQRVLNIIIKKFQSGFRKSSNIDYERFQNYYFEAYGEKCPQSLELLNQYLLTDALVFDDRAYAYGDDVVTTIRTALENMNFPCIFIDTFFSVHSEDLYAVSVFSTEMLSAFIRKYYDDISVKWDYVLMSDTMSPTDIIKAVFSERDVWTIDELYQRLPLLKPETIRQAMNTPEYIRIDAGKYTYIDNMDLPDSEGEKIILFVKTLLLTRDYVIANELDLSIFEKLNPHCPFFAIRDAVFCKFLSTDYDKRSQVITRKGAKLRVLDILMKYCRDTDMVSFQELNDFEATFDPEGRTHSQCLIAGYAAMTRVSSELFVSDSHVNFDVQKIDEAIALYCSDDFIPLQRITDFSLFPYVGYSWNLFLLESFLRKSSQAFKFDVRAVNSANIGAIIKRSFHYENYEDILSAALAKSPIDLNDKTDAGNYLFEHGYIGWRNLGKNEERIMQHAKGLREGEIKS